MEADAFRNHDKIPAANPGRFSSQSPRGAETFDEGRLAERIMLGAWAHGVGSSVGWFSPEDAIR